MGNTEILKRGDVQLTSAGTGITHSEVTHGESPVHFLQIWTFPQNSGLAPSYYTRHFTDEEKRDDLVPVVAPVGSTGVSDVRQGDGPTPIHSSVWLYVTILSAGKSVTHSLNTSQNGSNGKKAYIQVVQTSGYNPGKASACYIKVNGDLYLYEGDGASVQGSVGDEISIENVGQGDAEVLLFDLD